MTQPSKSNWAALLPPNWRSSVQAWLQEDIPGFDVGGFVVGEKMSEAHLLQKSPGMLCGVPFFNAVFESLDCTVEWLAQDGDVTHDLGSAGRKLMAVVRGPIRKILLGERTALNIITRASGIATLSHDTVSIASRAGWTGMVAGTRKTTPGFRLVEKYALLVGGAATHRHDLSQMVMLKDNHVWSAGNITKAVHQAKLAAGFSMKVEVEARTLDEALEAARAGADIVMLDNFDPPGLKAAAQEVKRVHPHVLIEASGGITNDTIHEFFSPHVDIISRGALTQGYGCLDFSLKVQPHAKTS